MFLRRQRAFCTGFEPSFVRFAFNVRMRTEREAKAVDDVVSSLSRAAACLSVGLRIVNQMPRVRYRTAVRVLRSGCATFSYWWHTLSFAMHEFPRGFPLMQ